MSVIVYRAWQHQPWGIKRPRHSRSCREAQKMQFFNVEKLFDFILICLFGWNGCASSSLLLWLVNEHFCRGLREKSVWHSPDTCELMTLRVERESAVEKINRLIYSPRRLMKHPQDTSNVFFVCLSNSQYLSKDYWLGVNWALLLLHHRFLHALAGASNIVDDIYILWITQVQSHPHRLNPQPQYARSLGPYHKNTWKIIIPLNRKLNKFFASLGVFYDLPQWSLFHIMRKQ